MDMMLYSPVKISYVSEEHVTSCFLVEEYAKQEIGVKQAASRGAHLPPASCCFLAWL
jgi:hypothetical protein